MTSPHSVAAFCESAYRRFHRPGLISPDPLEVVLEERDPRDREIVALIASSLALGRVELIVQQVRLVVRRLRSRNASIARALRDTGPDALHELFQGFRYRFFDEDQIVGLLSGIGRVITAEGSLEAPAAKGANTNDPLVSGLSRLVDEIVEAAEGRLDSSILLSRPERGSACKRLFLFARWLVRRDAIDPGGWTVFHPSQLLVPVDTHVIRVARRLGMTARTQPSLLASREITECLRGVDPADPVRFDFCLTRPGINPAFDEAGWLDCFDAQPA